MKIIKIIVLCLLISSSSLVSYSQNNVENLKTQLKTVEDSKKSSIAYKIALFYYDSDDKLCEKYAEDAIDFAKESSQKVMLTNSYHLLAMFYVKTKDYKKAVKYYDREYDVLKSTDHKKDIAMVLFNLGNLHNKLGNNRRSTKNFEESLAISTEINYHYLTKRTYNLLYEVYYERRKYDKALTYLKQYIEIAEFDYKSEKELEIEEANNLIALKDSLIVEKDSVNEVITDENEELSELTKEQQLEIDNLSLQNKLSKEELSNQRLSILVLVLILVFCIAIAGFIYSRFLQKKKNNLTLTEKNNIINQQNEEIKVINNNLLDSNAIIVDKNKKITDSIKYAKKIQKAVFPSTELIKSVFPKHFIFFEPRDIVSGDFYWSYKTQNKLFVIAADCTGHGIPGSFMSLLSISFLNEIVPKAQNRNAGEILNFLRQKVKTTLGQKLETPSQKDGLDIAMCIINTEDLTMDFAGANNPVYILRNKSRLDNLDKVAKLRITEHKELRLIEIKGDRQPVAVYIKERSFTNHKFKLQKEDKIYMFSDGYADQFGGEKNKKFMTKRFKQLLFEVHEKEMEEQNKIIKNTLHEWQGRNKRVDDVLVLGLKI